MHENEAIARVRHNQASERPEARIALTKKFTIMSPDEKRIELENAEAYLADYDQGELSSETSSEDPFLRGHRIVMEETVSLLRREL